jgi:hypothetical protein
MEHTLRTTNLDLDRTVNGHEQRGPINDASCIKLASIASSKLSIQAEINDPFSSHWFSHPHRAVPCTWFSNSTVLQRTTGTLYKWESGLPIVTRLFVSSPQSSRARNQLSMPLAPQYATGRFPTRQPVRTSKLNRLSSFCSFAVAVYTSARKFLCVYPYVGPCLILRKAPTYYVYEPYDCMSTSGLTSSQNSPLVVPHANATYRAYRSMVIPG